MITYRCSAACRHCLVLAEPRQPRTVMRVEDAVRWGLEYAKLGRHVMIAGGDHVYVPDVPLEDAAEMETVVRDEERLRAYARSRKVSHIGRAADALSGFVDPVPLGELLT